MNLGNMTQEEVVKLLKECIAELPIEVLCDALRDCLDDDDRAEVSAQLEDNLRVPRPDRVR